jgi:hypothetical protein
MCQEFCTMKEIGQLFGVTSHVIGKKLKEIGLRTKDGKPSHAAFNGGFCDQRWTTDSANYCWAWEKTKTVEALEQCGFTKGFKPK